jgi:hypothetical protein
MKVLKLHLSKKLLDSHWGAGFRVCAGISGFRAAGAAFTTC